MGYCTPAQTEEFLQTVPKFEEMLVHSGVKLLKYYLDISKAEQKVRLAARAIDPLKQWKVSPVDSVALKHWKDYSKARDIMLLRTDTVLAPWHIVHADDKKLARLNLIRDILHSLDYKGKKARLVEPDARIVCPFSADMLDAKLLAP
jgi:polyphosphate kinase 2 (PPK2 family)